MKHTIRLPQVARTAIAAGILCASFFSAFAQQAVNDEEALRQETWRGTIVRAAVPGEGCFQASYPSLTWSRIECTIAPNIPFRPRSGNISQTVGEGNDYAAKVTTGMIKKTTGSFPKVTGVTSETGTLGANDYSLQLNSNFMNTAACDGAGNPPECRAWEQFIYASGYQVAFMQYWLINWSNPCPSGWLTSGNNCYTNSAAVSAPQAPIIQLKTFKLSGSAKKGGTDKLVFAVGTQAYSTTGSDSVVDLATAWTESEFNIFGDGNGSEANFNSGSSLTVKVTVSNGTTNAPTCASGAGTSGETNNLALGICAGTGGTAPYIEFNENTHSETVLYSFCSQPGCTDGELPNGGLIMDSNGNLYGTTFTGGAGGAVCHGGYGCGTVFELNANGVETVLHSFTNNGLDGMQPTGGLIMGPNGNLYGTTEYGGTTYYFSGTVFEISPSGTETVLYSFCSQIGCTDGASPYGELLMDTKGNLYGTTLAGGAYGHGTVFKLSPSGTVTVLYSFCSQTGCPDGSYPNGGLIMDPNGNLYGTTYEGGLSSSCFGGYGCGIVFKLSPDGAYSILHTFANNGTDGANPEAGLIMDKKGNLYGTTEAGGAYGYECGSLGCGTVFKLSPDGTETILHSFGNGTDGFSPISGLVMDAKGNLYGATTVGGASGGGIIFELSRSGTETVLHSFCSQQACTDGEDPYLGRLIMDANGNLYGTTFRGGAYGDGTVFRVTP